jgi:hypothetical protein
MLNYTPSIIAAQVPSFGSGYDIARAPGPIIPYEYSSTRPKKQLKELRSVLLAEKKKFIFKYGFKFNLMHRCVVCGSLHEWEASDPMRPPIPLSEVTKGRPLKGTYCPKHAGFLMQREMLEQQMLAEEHGLEFRRFIPKAKVPSMMKRGPLTSLNEKDMTSLISMGWAIKPPEGLKETPREQYVRLMVDISGKLKQIENLVGVIEEGD